MRLTRAIIRVLALAAGTEALNVFKLPFRKAIASTPVDRLSKRFFSVPYHNNFPVYLVDITVGTPPQNLQVVLDTGSSDLIVETTSSDLCTSNSSPCTYGAYSANASSTYQYVSSTLQVSYAGGEEGSGDFVKDTFRIGEAILPNFQFGAMYKTGVTRNIFGVGYVDNEFARTSERYPNFPVALVAAGYIPSRVFSLYLDSDLDESGGTVLFGGIDTQKYCGPLSKLVTQKTNFLIPKVAEFLVTLKSVSGIKNGAHTSFATGTVSSNALLDSGTTVTFLPVDLAFEIYTYVGGSFDFDNQVARVPCSVKDQDITIQYEFDTITINVLISQLVGFPDGTGSCYFGIFPTNSQIILGDTFLSSAYAVFDLDNNNVYLAQAQFNSMEENIVQIQAGPNGVPQPNGACAGNPTSTTTTATATTTATTTPTTTSSTTRSTTRSITTTTMTTSRTTSQTTSRSTTKTITVPTTTKNPSTKSTTTKLTAPTPAPPKCYKVSHDQE
ncbi:hypothetical protein TWF694_008176 [Orbilia ellipsospora]|uniref:Peptidase A1 domain-containing protein n=1 Tax=Orbilia ellipsospora TaxID=2528407 RepID=A0AAV9XGU0_9PEZI